MTKGRQIPINSTVRRRLFSEDEPPRPGATRNHNCPGTLYRREWVARNMKNEIILKGMKWCFDFGRERPIDGPIQWFQRDGGEDWVGMQPTGRHKHFQNITPCLGSPQLIYEHERSKKRRCPSRVVQRQVFFYDLQVQSDVNRYALDDNITNNVRDENLQTNEGIRNWNFDFENRVPLKGPIEWQRVGDDWVGNMPGYDSRIVMYASKEEENMKTVSKESKDENEMKIEEVEKQVNAIVNVVTEQVRVVYGDKKTVAGQHKIITLVLEDTDEPLTPKDDLKNNTLESTDLEEQIIPKERLSDMIRRKNEVTPRH